MDDLREMTVTEVPVVAVDETARTLTVVIPDGLRFDFEAAKAGVIVVNNISALDFIRVIAGDGVEAELVELIQAAQQRTQ